MQFHKPIIQQEAFQLAYEDGESITLAKDDPLFRFIESLPQELEKAHKQFCFLHESISTVLKRYHLPEWIGSGMTTLFQEWLDHLEQLIVQLKRAKDHLNLETDEIKGEE